MKNIIFLLLPLFIFGYYDFSLRKSAEILELTEDFYTDYYLNPAIIADLKERFINVGIYGNSQTTQFVNLNFLNPNRIFPCALILTNFETEFSSEKSLAFLLSKKMRDYSCGFKVQIGEIKNLWENFFNYEKNEFILEKESPLGDSSAEEFYFEGFYFSEKEVIKKSNYYQFKNTLLFFPTAFYLKFKDLEIGIDFANSVEKRISKKENEELFWKIKEEYEYAKEGDSILNYWVEYLIRENTVNHLYQKEIESLKIQNKDISLFLRKKVKGIKEKKIFFARLGHSFENTKGNINQRNLNEIYESSLEWGKEYDGNAWQSDSEFLEESNSVSDEKKIMVTEKRENIYQEAGFGFNYYLSFLKFDNTLFLGIKEKIDLSKREKEWEKRGKVYGYLGNNFEKGGLSFSLIFVPYLILERNNKNGDKKIKISYNYHNFLGLKLKIFDFLTGQFHYLLPGEKGVSSQWIFALSLNY